MASLAQFLIALFVCGFSLVLAEDPAPLLTCTGSSDRQMAPADRIKNFIECLRDQGHDEELLAELTRSFDGQGNAVTASSCPPSDERGRFPYCSGMTDLQCRTLILVLESLLNVPASDGAGGSPGPRDDPVLDSISVSPEDERIQGALMKVILERFNDIVDEYRRWRIDHGGGGGGGGGGTRAKRSVKTYLETGEEEEQEEEEEEVPGRIVDKSSSSHEDVPHPPQPTTDRRIGSFRRPLTRRVRRQGPPGLPFKLPDRLTPEMQAVLDGYLAWREKNGYGRSTNRWG